MALIHVTGAEVMDMVIYFVVGFATAGAVLFGFKRRSKK